MSPDQIRAVVVKLAAPAGLLVEMPLMVWGSTNMGVMLKAPGITRRSKGGAVSPKASFTVSPADNEQTVTRKVHAAMGAIACNVQTGWFKADAP